MLQIPSLRSKTARSTVEKHSDEMLSGIAALIDETASRGERPTLEKLIETLQYELTALRRHAAGAHAVGDGYDISGSCQFSADMIVSGKFRLAFGRPQAPDRIPKAGAASDDIPTSLIRRANFEPGKPVRAAPRLFSFLFFCLCSISTSDESFRRIIYFNVNGKSGARDRGRRRQNSLSCDRI